ncbi:hypothetical protein ACS0TY_014908 [Phlomoides rotata]
MKVLETPAKQNDSGERGETQKPYFRPTKDDSKPLLQDPILRSNPIETEEVVLRLACNVLLITCKLLCVQFQQGYRMNSYFGKSGNQRQSNVCLMRLRIDGG